MVAGQTLLRGVCILLMGHDDAPALGLVVGSNPFESEIESVPKVRAVGFNDTAHGHSLTPEIPSTDTVEDLVSQKELRCAVAACRKDMPVEAMVVGEEEHHHSVTSSLLLMREVYRLVR
jgi:hypothetical protein